MLFMWSLYYNDAYLYASRCLLNHYRPYQPAQGQVLPMPSLSIFYSHYIFNEVDNSVGKTCCIKIELHHLLSKRQNKQQDCMMIFDQRDRSVA